MFQSLKGKTFFAFFIVTHFLLSSFYLDWQQRWNSTSRMLTLLSVCHYHTLNIDLFHERTEDKCFVNGHYYSEKAPLPVIITIPFYFFFKSTADLTPDQNGLIGKWAYITGDILCGVVPFVFLISVLLYKLQREKSIIPTYFLATLPIYSSFVFLYCGAFMSHLLAGALLLSSWLLLKDAKKYFLSGVFAGFAFLSDFPLGISIPIFAFGIFSKEKSLKKPFEFILGFLPSLFFLFAFNYFVTGNPAKLPYQFVSNEAFVGARNTLGFTGIHISALWKMLFSEYRGIFLYFPIFILIMFEFTKSCFAKRKITINPTLFSFAVLFYLLICTHKIWWGGACIGPRHLIPVSILVAFEGSRFLSRNKFSGWGFYILMLSGLVCSWMAVSTAGYRIADEIENPFTKGVFHWFIEGKFNPGNILTLFFNISPKFAAWIWLLCFGGLSIILNKWFQWAVK